MYRPVIEWIIFMIYENVWKFFITVLIWNYRKWKLKKNLKTVMAYPFIVWIVFNISMKAYEKVLFTA
jgi:hypothetical protein